MLNQDYEDLFALSKKIRILEGISSLLEWDQETYLPQGAHKIRSQQIGTMAEWIHKEKISDTFKKALEKLIDLKSGQVISKDLNDLQKAALREWRRDFIKATALPNDFVKDFATHCSEAIKIWTQARKDNQFSLFAPHLEKTVAMSRKKAEYLGYQDHPYDALIDMYEPKMTTQQLTTLFSELGKGIKELLQKIVNSPHQVDDGVLHGKFPHEKQIGFGKILLEAMGFDFNCGRLDLSTHPFSSTIHPTDSRITTRFHETSCFDSISTILHEGGHSLYEMGLNPDYYGSPLCEAVSLGIHESQSRFWETRIGKDIHLWKHFYPKLQETYPEQLQSVALEDFYRAINKVKPSFIRVEADEVTYCLHVIIRFELEKALIEGSLKVSELPDAWNEKMHYYLGITPPNDSKGCLQDIHWSMGGFGYFPTYALGNIYAAEIFEGFAKDHQDWKEKVSQGELIFIKEWLHNHIYQYGRAYLPQELLQRITGRPLSIQPYLHYLNEKYSKVYSF